MSEVFNGIRYSENAIKTSPILSALKKLKDTQPDYDVKLYGAVGDGIADDTVAIQKAIDANNSVLLFDGTFRITSELIVSGKTDFTIFSESATLLLDIPEATVSGKYCINVSDCVNFSAQGRLYLTSTSTLDVKPAVANVDAGGGIIVTGSRSTTIDDVFIDGPFDTGIRIGTQIAGINALEASSIDNVVIKNCLKGIDLIGEYYSVNNARVSYCRTGINVIGGNNSISTSHCILNRIGIAVIGGVVFNSDHGKIEGCSLNHNILCGLFIKDTQYSTAVTDTQIWANIGDDAFPVGFLPVTFTADEVLAAAGRTTQFGVYLQNVEGINMTSNFIARNNVNLAVDGYVNTTISSNTFITDDGRTSSHIIEYGNAHSGFNVNAQNSICNNIFDGNYVNGAVNGDKRIKFFNNTGNTTQDDKSIAVVNNRGTTGLDYLPLLNVGSGTIVFDPNYESMLFHINTAFNITLHSSWAGSTMKIAVFGVTAAETKTMVLASAATYNGTASPVILSTGLAYNAGTKTYTFSANGLYTFIPYGSSVNEWCVYRSI